MEEGAERLRGRGDLATPSYLIRAIPAEGDHLVDPAAWWRRGVLRGARIPNLLIRGSEPRRTDVVRTGQSSRIARISWR